MPTKKGDCEGCGKWVMSIVDSEDSPLKCDNCQKSVKVSNDPTFSKYSSPSLKGRFSDGRKANQLSIQAMGHKTGSEEWKEIKAEQKKYEQSQAKRKLSTMEVDDINEAKKREKQADKSRERGE